MPRQSPGQAVNRRAGTGRRGSSPRASPARGRAADRIDRRIAELGDWRGRTLATLRRIIRSADPEIVEEWKWENPVWSLDGIICTGEAYRHTVKLTFPRGASLEDPDQLFNASLAGKVRRAIDIRQGEPLRGAALKALIRSAVAQNRRYARPSRPPTPVRLAGGNPQIAKADGPAPVRAYIAAMPGWKRSVGRRLDTLITRLVPNLHKAVRWNSPFYGVPGQGWFLAFHVFTRYVKVTFFRGAALRPVPPGGTGKDARWIDIHQDDWDEVKLTAWITQAAALPGWSGGKSTTWPGSPVRQ